MRLPQMPPPGAPVLDDTGTMQEPWYLFFSDLFSVTGAAGRQLPLWANAEVSALSMAPDIVSAPTLAFVGGGLVTYEFGPSFERSLHFSTSLPRAYNENTPIYPYLLYSFSGLYGGNMVWNLTYSWSKEGDDVSDSTTVSMQVPVIDGEQAQLKKYVNTSPLSQVDRPPGSTLLCKISRDGDAAGDDSDSEGLLLAVGFQHERNVSGTPER